MIEIALDKDEIYPYFIADDEFEVAAFHDAIVLVDKGWYEEYNMVRAKFWDMQNELAALYFEGDGPDDEADCE